MSSELMEALRQIQREKSIDPGTILDALAGALLTAFKKNYPEVENPQIEIDPDTAHIRVFADIEVRGGDVERREVTPKDFGRIAAQTAKQVILQRIREEERDLMYDEYIGREGDIATGIIEQSDHRYTLVNFGRVEALLPISEQVNSERYDHGSRLKTYILEVRKGAKGPQIIVSRTHPGLLKRLFELEVPEIYEGIVEIKSVAREGGHRSKVAVVSTDPSIDPVGACVGPKGSRVRMVVNELRGEKIDIVQWSEDPSVYVANALSPAKVSEVRLFDEEKRAEVVVPDSQLSLAIGKEGQNARLAAKLTGWRIDIRSESQKRGDALTAATAALAAGAEAVSSAARAGSEPEAVAAATGIDPAGTAGGEGQCEAVTSDGQRCKNTAKPGSRFCGIPAHRKQG